MMGRCAGGDIIEALMQDTRGMLQKPQTAMAERGTFVKSSVFQAQGHREDLQRDLQRAKHADCYQQGSVPRHRARHSRVASVGFVAFGGCPDRPRCSLRRGPAQVR